MAYMVLVQGGVAVEANSSDPSDPSVAGWIDVTGVLVAGKRPGVGWTWNGSVWAPPPEPTPRKRAYALAAWLDALTEAELDVILDYVNGDTGTTAQKRAARRVWHHWRAMNLVDMNVQKNQDILTWLVNNSGGVWTAARRTELIG